jgi:hypothetical protein
VAAETGWPLDKVVRYAAPPLGERAYVADQAKAVEISRSRGGSTLEQSVAARMAVEPSEVVWDSHRTGDGRWIVTAAVDSRVVGTWAFEAVGRSVHPQDESARALMGGGPSAVDATETSTAPTETVARGSAEKIDDAEQADQDAAPARPRLVSVTSDPVQAQQASGEQEELLDQSELSVPQRAKRTKSKKGRASVPSWDEILFGASRPQD